MACAQEHNAVPRVRDTNRKGGQVCQSSPNGGSVRAFGLLCGDMRKLPGAGERGRDGTMKSLAASLTGKS